MNELERCRPFIERAISRAGGDYTWQDVEKGVLGETMQLWPAENGCLVTQVWDFPKRRVLHIIAAGGELGQLKDMQESVVAYAKAWGCAGLTLEGRRGWVRALADLGWAEKSTRMELEI